MVDASTPVSMGRMTAGRLPPAVMKEFVGESPATIPNCHLKNIMRDLMDNSICHPPNQRALRQCSAHRSINVVTVNDDISILFLGALAPFSHNTTICDDWLATAAFFIRIADTIPSSVAEHRERVRGNGYDRIR